MNGIIREERSYKVIKSNELIQRARYDLNKTELKTLAYIFSKIKPYDKEDEVYTFPIADYCNVCGIDICGKNYENVKAALKGLRDKSIWVTDEKGREHTIGWLGYVTIDKGSGKVAVELDKRMSKYIHGLFKNFTQYELISVLPMGSTYSIRMYELLKSYSNLTEHTFDIDELKKTLFANYSNFKDFRRRVLDVAVKEINLYTDLEVSWKPETKGRKVTEVTFYIRVRKPLETMANHSNSHDQLEGQMNIADFSCVLPE